jgi:hypothetical protein
LMTGLVGCGNENQANQPQQQAESTEEVQTQSKYPFPENVQQMGAGKVSIQTSSGDSATGTTPVLFVEKDTAIAQIGYTLEGFDGSKEVFVFINKVFNQAAQAGEMFQSSLDLEGDFLQPGDYIVTAIQYEGNDPKSGKVTHYHETNYTVKQGS